MGVSNLMGVFLFHRFIGFFFYISLLLYLTVSHICFKHAEITLTDNIVLFFSSHSFSSLLFSNIVILKSPDGVFTTYLELILA